MSGTEFEDYVARIARSCGDAGDHDVGHRATGGWISSSAGRPNRLAIQCKRLTRPVGTGAIQEVVAGAPMQDCTRTMVVHQPRIHPGGTQTRGAARLRYWSRGSEPCASRQRTIRRLTAEPFKR